MKNRVMESLFKIKSLAARFTGVTIAHDMTLKQRE